MVIGGLVLLASLITMVLTWPTRRRRGLGKKKKAATSGDTDAAAADGEAPIAGSPLDSAGGRARDGDGPGTEDPLRTRHTV